MNRQSTLNLDDLYMIWYGLFIDEENPTMQIVYAHRLEFLRMVHKSMGHGEKYLQELERLVLIYGD